MAGKPQKPAASYVVNGWYLELPGLVSPRFETLSGLSMKTGTVEVVDAGTNIKYKFASQILDFSGIGLTRNMDGSADDLAMDAIVALSITAGQKFAGVLIKMHFNNPVFSIAFDGLRFVEDNWPDFNIEGEDKLIKTYQATVDTWLRV